MRPLNPELHNAGEKIAVPRHYAEMASWQVAAELVRRHPNEFVVIETHPGGGQYDCLSIYERRGVGDRPRFLNFAHLNRIPRGHITSRGWGVDEKRLNWVDVLFADDLRNEIIIPLEDYGSIAPPAQTPPTTPSSIGVRLIAEALSLRVATRSPLVALNGVHDSSNGSGIRGELFAEFQAITNVMSESDDFDIETVPAYRYWFVCVGADGGSERRTLFGVDTWDGKLWYKNESEVDLMDLYKDYGSDITTMASGVLYAATSRV